VSTAEAVMVLALCYAADEVGTHAVLRAGGRETMIQKRGVRIALKVSLLPLFAKKQKKSAAIRWGTPLAYCGAGAWNGFVVLPKQRTSK
jgi:hypothetical protein